MRYLEGEEIKEAEKCASIALEYAKNSTCKKSQRVAVLVKSREIIGIGCNKVTDEKYCNPCIRENIHDNSRIELCSANHAEQLAILDALKKGKNIEGSRLYHNKVKNGEIKHTEDVSCTVCSRFILESGISEVVLLHEKGFALYNSKEFNKLSFKYFLNK